MTLKPSSLPSSSTRKLSASDYEPPVRSRTVRSDVRHGSWRTTAEDSEPRLPTLDRGHGSRQYLDFYKRRSTRPGSNESQPGGQFRRKMSKTDTTARTAAATKNKSRGKRRRSHPESFTLEPRVTKKKEEPSWLQNNKSLFHLGLFVLSLVAFRLCHVYSKSLPNLGNLSPAEVARDYLGFFALTFFFSRYISMIALALVWTSVAAFHFLLNIHYYDDPKPGLQLRHLEYFVVMYVITLGILLGRKALVGNGRKGQVKLHPVWQHEDRHQRIRSDWTTSSACSYREKQDIAAINDPNIPIEQMVYLFQFDSTHKKIPWEVSIEGQQIVIKGNKITVFTESAGPAAIPWDTAGVNLVIECSGLYTTYEVASGHLGEKVKKVIVAGRCENIPMFVMGVNHEMCTADKNVVSAASATANCLAPLLKVLHEEFTVVEGFMTTVHAVKSHMRVLDGPVKPPAAWRDGRSAMQNIIPATTGAAKAIGKIIPDLNGKISGRGHSGACSQRLRDHAECPAGEGDHH
ncbi:unnamed protein product [Sphagnum tenellum]